MNMIELKDLIMSSPNPEAIFTDHANEIIEFINELDRVGTNLVKDKGEDFLKALLEVTWACALTSAVMQREVNPLNAIFFAHDREIRAYIALVIKYTLAIAVQEEIR